MLNILSIWLFSSSLRKEGLDRNSVHSNFSSIGEDQKRSSSGPAPRGRHFGAVPPNEICAPQSEDWTPKKVLGSVPLECNSMPGTLKILVVTPEFVRKNCFFADFAINTFFFVVPPQKLWKFVYFLKGRPFIYLFIFLVFTPEFVEIRDENLLVFGPQSRIWSIEAFVPPPKIVSAPPVALSWCRAWTLPKVNRLFQSFRQWVRAQWVRAYPVKKGKQTKPILDGNTGCMS